MSASFSPLRTADCVDFHTHILPEMDDGSASAAESRQMLQTAAQNGVSCVVLTPHYLAERESPEDFLSRREQSLNLLRREWDGELPRLIPGAEVAYYDGISSLEALPALCAGQSRCLLLEMPFRPWTERMLAEIAVLTGRGGYHVVLAHTERYRRFQNKEVFARLIGEGVRFQTNAGMFIDRRTRRTAFRLLRKGYIHLLGSDCHNRTSRPPNLGEACRLIREKGCADALDTLMRRSAYLLGISDPAGKREVEV